jgi:predicted metalloprotease with PDZ domain
VVPYTLDDVLAGLNEISPQDWRKFFQERVYRVNPRAPLGGIEAAGWRLTYMNAPSGYLQSVERCDKYTDLSFSLGLTIKEDGVIRDVVPGSPAGKAGVGVAMKLLAVNGRRWTAELLRTAVKEAQSNSAPIELLVENEDYFVTCPVDYHGGEKYPVLERDPANPDLLTRILEPLTEAPGH